jgi:hypothetical protein
MEIYTDWPYIRAPKNALLKVDDEGIPLFFQQESRGYEFRFFTGERIAVYNPPIPGAEREAAIDWWNATRKKTDE